ncbi:MAG: hypothetical protein ACK5MU_02520 [Candidatus Saccharimonadales bacterium]
MDNNEAQPNPMPNNQPEGDTQNTNFEQPAQPVENMGQPIFEQPPVMEQPPMAEQEPQPIVPGFGVPSQPADGQTQPVVPKKPMDPKTKKLIIIICSVGGGLLLLGLAALIILPIILKVDYEKTYDLADDTNDIRYDIQGYDSCGGVISYVNSSYQSTSSYEKYVSECKSDLAAFKEGVSSLAGDNGVNRDSDIKAKWDEFKTSYDRAFAPYEQLVDIYSDWHTFVAGWYDATSGSDWWETMNESKVKSLTSTLTNSSNEGLKKYGEGFVTVRWKQVKAYQTYKSAYNAYYDASYSAPNKSTLRDAMNAASEAYNGANQDYKDYITDEPDIKDTEKLVGIDIDKNENQFLSKFADVYSIASTKYIEQGFKDAIGL